MRPAVFIVLFSVATVLGACGAREDLATSSAPLASSWQDRSTAAAALSHPAVAAPPSSPSAQETGSSRASGSPLPTAGWSLPSSSPPRTAAAPQSNDGQITAQVSARLASARDLGNVRIDVDTREGVVTLSGPVATAAAKVRAGEIARSVPGVQQVNDQLTLVTG